MINIDMREEAENCRRQALTYVGQPEAPFLLRIAEAFEDLLADQRPKTKLEHGNNHSE